MDLYLSSMIERHLRLQRKLADTHARAHKTAFRYYIRKGFIPQELQNILCATQSVETLLKYGPDQPRVPAGSPDGGNGQAAAIMEKAQTTITTALTHNWYRKFHFLKMQHQKSPPQSPYLACPVVVPFQPTQMTCWIKAMRRSQGPKPLPQVIAPSEIQKQVIS